MWRLSRARGDGDELEVRQVLIEAGYRFERPSESTWDMCHEEAGFVL